MHRMHNHFASSHSVFFLLEEEKFRAPKKEVNDMFRESDYAKDGGEQESICRKCGRPKEEVLSEIDFSHQLVCLRCDSSSESNLSIREIKGLMFD